MPEDWVELRVEVPRSWREELKAAARAQGISMSDLVRIVLRRFLRGRYSEDEQRALQERT